MVPVPEIQMEWDEASCGQLVWLYNEAISHFGGQTESFFASLARTDREPEPGVQPGRALRVASIDIGGGTTDMAITHYQLDDGSGNNVKITPQLLFREGFKVAGDDTLLDVIQRYVLPALQTQLQKSGIADASLLMSSLFGDSGRIDTRPCCASKRRYSSLCRLATPFLPRGNPATLTIRWLACMPPLAIFCRRNQPATS